MVQDYTLFPFCCKHRTGLLHWFQWMITLTRHLTTGLSSLTSKLWSIITKQISGIVVNILLHISCICINVFWTKTRCGCETQMPSIMAKIRRTYWYQKKDPVTRNDHMQYGSSYIYYFEVMTNINFIKYWTNVNLKVNI